MSDLVGRDVVVAISCVDPRSGAEIDRFTVRGTVEESDDTWIAIRREGLGTLFGLPPGTEPFTAEAGGALGASLTVQVGDAESLLALRGVGFAPT